MDRRRIDDENQTPTNEYKTLNIKTLFSSLRADLCGTFLHHFGRGGAAPSLCPRRRRRLKLDSDEVEPTGSTTSSSRRNHHHGVDETKTRSIESDCVQMQQQILAGAILFVVAFLVLNVLVKMRETRRGAKYKTEATTMLSEREILSLVEPLLPMGIKFVVSTTNLCLEGIGRRADPKRRTVETTRVKRATTRKTMKLNVVTHFSTWRLSQAKNAVVM